MPFSCRRALILLFMLLLPALLSAAQQPQTARKAPAKGKSTPKAEAKAAPASKHVKDQKIVDVMHSVSAQRIQATIEKLVTFGTRNTLSSNNPDAAISDKGIVAARKWIESEFERYSKDCGGCLEVKTDTFTEPASTRPNGRIPTPTEISNVYAILRGTDPAQAKRIFLVTGHYDSRNTNVLDTTGAAPGANDDGSGTAVSLECARVLSKHKFPATIIFLTVAGEEQGLNGSSHFARMAKSEGWEIQGALNNDIVGGNRTPGDTRQNNNWVRVFSEGIPAGTTEAELRRIRAIGSESDSTSRQLARFIADLARTYDFGRFTPKLIFRGDRYLRGGDHNSFNEQGYPAVRFTEYREDFNHQHQNLRTENGIEYGDLPKFVDFNYVANVARLNAATLAALASAPPPPEQLRLLTRGLDNGSQLQWEATPGAVAYEVLWRRTTDAEFPEENAIRTTETKADIDMSKDNVIFGVRSVDAKGHRSVIEVPGTQQRQAPPPAAGGER